MGTHVGQSAPKVHALFKEGWGKTIFFDEISAITKSGAAYGKDVANALLTYLQDEEYRRKFVFCMAGYEDDIEKVFRLDDGLSSRFNHVVTIPRWDVETSLKCLKQVYMVKYEEDLNAFEEILRSEFSTIVESEEYASGRTISDVLALKIKKGANRNKPSRMVTEEIIREVFNEVRPNYPAPTNDNRRPPTPPPSSPAPRLAFEQEVEEEQEEEKEQQGNERGRKILNAIDTVNGMFSDLANNDPEAFERAEADPNSDYNKELAKQLTNDLGEEVKPEQAKEVRVRVARIKKQKITTLETQQITHFEYHCPHCDRVEHPGCLYINHPLDYKLEHSRKPPWSETIEKEIESEVDVLVYEEVIL